MEFGLSEDQVMLQETIRRFVADEASWIQFAQLRTKRAALRMFWTKRSPRWVWMDYWFLNQRAVQDSGFLTPFLFKSVSGTDLCSLDFWQTR